MAFPPQSTVASNVSYLGDSFGSPFNLMIECYKYSNNKQVRAYGGADVLGSFVLPIPKQFQSAIAAQLEDVRAKEGGLLAAVTGTGFATDQEIAIEEFFGSLDRFKKDIQQAFSGKDLRRVMDNTDAFFVKNEKRVFKFDFDIIVEDSQKATDVLKTFESLSAFALPEANINETDLFRITPPAMARVTVGYADQDGEGTTTVYNTGEASETWLSNPKLCLIDSVSVARDASSMFYSPSKGPMPNNIVASVVLTEIEPIFRFNDRGNVTVASRSEALIGRINSSP